MSLSAEERQRIYEEEKARLEAQARIHLEVVEAAEKAAAERRATEARQATEQTVRSHSDMRNGLWVLMVAIVLSVAIAIDHSHTTIGAIVVLLLLGLYALPSIIAVQRHAAIEGTVIIINLALGWTVIGWVVAMAMAYGPTRAPTTPDG